MRCSSNPQTQNQVHCEFELNRLPSTAATGSKSHSAHSTHQSPNVDQLNIIEVQISIESRCKKKKCWQIQLNGKNQPNHRSEPAEPLDSPHESPISRNENFVREEGCPHELSCGCSRTCAISFAPRPRAFTKIAIFVLQNVPKWLKQSKQFSGAGAGPAGPAAAGPIISLKKKKKKNTFTPCTSALSDWVWRWPPQSDRGGSFPAAVF